MQTFPLCIFGLVLIVVGLRLYLSSLRDTADPPLQARRKPVLLLDDEHGKSKQDQKAMAAEVDQSQEKHPGRVEGGAKIASPASHSRNDTMSEGEDQQLAHATESVRETSRTIGQAETVLPPFPPPEEALPEFPSEESAGELAEERPEEAANVPAETTVAVVQTQVQTQMQAPVETQEENLQESEFPGLEQKEPEGGKEHRGGQEVDRGQQLAEAISNRSIPGNERLSLIREAGEVRFEKTVPALIEALSDPDPEIAAAASAALVGIGDPRAIEPLLEMVRRNDEQLLSDGPEVENYEQYLPTGIGGPERKPFDEREAIVPQAELLPKEYLQADGTPLPPKELVLRGLKAEDQQLRKMAAKLAAGLGDLDLLVPLVESLENTQEQESVRYLAAEALGGIHDGRAIEPLVKALKDESVAVRYSAAAALSGRTDSRVVEALIEALQDPNEFVRSSVAYALGQIGDRSSVEPLLKALDDEFDVVRFSVAKALGTIGGEDVLGGLGSRLEKAEGRLRTAIIDALGQVKDERATALLRKALLDEDVEVSYRASMALMNGEGAEAIDEIIEASRRFDRELMDLMNPDARGN